MPPVLSIVGKSNSGKTTLIEKLIPELKRRGYRVGVVKHAHHGFDMDRKGKDSYRHRQAGAATVMIASPGQIAMIKNSSTESLNELATYFEDVDLLISEGFKSDRAPKIEVFRSQQHRRPACLEDDTLIAMASDTAMDLAIPLFDLDDIEAITNFIVTDVLSQSRPDSRTDSQYKN